MKAFYIIIISTLIISSCSPKTKYFRDIKLSDKSIIVYDNGWTEPATKRSIRKLQSHNFVIIVNPSFFSKTFITSINPNILQWKCCLDSNKLIFNNYDTCFFPNYIPLNKTLIFSNNKTGDAEFRLTLTKISNSSIEYRYDLPRQGSKKLWWKGSADLSPDFFITSENDTDDQTGLPYKIVKYIDNSPVWVRIDIGKDPINENILLAKIGCDMGSFLKLSSKNCPTLIEKK